MAEEKEVILWVLGENQKLDGQHHLNLREIPKVQIRNIIKMLKNLQETLQLRFKLGIIGHQK